jgi:hypothetical protein
MFFDLDILHFCPRVINKQKLGKETPKHASS